MVYLLLSQCFTSNNIICLSPNWWNDPNDYFSKLSLIKILQIDSGLLIVIGICGWINGLEIISFSVLAFMMYLSSKVNPKLNSLLMAKLPPDILAQTSSFLRLYQYYQCQ